jgi:general stress protein YciG
VSTADRGFASMPPERVKEIASQGGKSAHAQKRAHEWTSDEAREAGRRGGVRSAAARRLRKLALQEQASQAAPQQAASADTN